MLRTARARHSLLPTTAALLLALAASSTVPAQFTYRPGQEYRSLNTDYYELAIQKNGRIDVALSSGETVFLDAFPMVRFEGDEKPEALKIDGRWSQRYEVNDALGRGNGMLLKYKNCEWSIRAYPSKPFFAVQVAFINTTKKPVSIAELLPWCVGEPRKGALTLGDGSKQAAILTNTFGRGDTGLLRGEAQSDTHLAVFNPANGRGVIAGFLTQTMALNSVTLSASRKKNKDVFDRFRAGCTFDPPALVEPGGRLNSEVIYLAIAETDLLEGLERYARAIAVAYDLAPRTPLLPHGWLVSGDALNEDSILGELDFMAESLKPFGWKHVSIGKGWQRAIGDWEADAARFPSGLNSLTEAIHARGLSAGIWLDPFRVHEDSKVAREHPEWLLDDPGGGESGGLRLLDITAPGVVEHVRELGARMRGWGFDAVEGVDTRALLDATGHRERARTRVEIARAGMVSLIDGVGSERFTSTSTPSLVAAPYFHGASATASSWMRGSYLAPHLWLPIPEAPRLGDLQGTTGTQEEIRKLMELALLGGAVQLQDAPSTLSAEHRDLLRRVLPTPHRPARPLDLFYSDAPRIWALPVDSPIGRWVVVAIFNHDDAENGMTTLPFSALKLDPDKYYTVYDFWEDRYYGTARETLEVNVSPGTVRVFGLRPHRDRPMFLSTDSHFTQGATDFTALKWDAGDRRLSGAFDAVKGTTYGLRFLIPDSYEVRNVETSLGPMPSETRDRVLRLAIACPRSESVTWSIQF